MKKAIAIIVSIALVGAVGFGGFKIYQAKNARTSMPMGNKPIEIFTTAQKQDIKETITASGLVILKEEYEVYAEGETNKIKTILVEEGDTVTQGQLLVEYDVDDTKENLENQIRDLKRDVQNQQLSIDSITAPKSESEMTKLKNAVTSAEKNLADAKNTYANYDTQIEQQQTTIQIALTNLNDAKKTVSDNAQLLEIGGISQSEYDQSESDLVSAQQNYDKAVNELNSLNTSKQSAAKSVTNAENSLTEAQNSLQDAGNVFSDEATRIKYEQQQLNLQATTDSLADTEKDLSELVYSTSSPVAGIVTEVCVDEGTYTEENTVILKVADFNQLLVTASIEEYDAPLLALGQRVAMTSDGLEGRVYTGTITKINPSATSASTMMGSETAVPIEISVDNPDGILKPGYNLDLEITTLDKQGVLAVANEAIGYNAEDGTSYVYTIGQNDKITKTTIEIGEKGDRVTEIISGIKENDRILNSSSYNIDENTTLQSLMEQQMPGNTSTESTDEQMPMDDMPGGGLPGGGMPGGGMQRGGMAGGMPGGIR